MARIVTNAEFDSFKPGWERDQVYNGNDTTGTREILDDLLPKVQADFYAAKTYAFERGLQNVAFTMMLRGVLVDPIARQEAIDALGKEEEAIEARLQDLVSDIWDKTEKRKGKCTDGKPHKWARNVADADNHCTKCLQSRLTAAKINPRSNGATGQVAKLLYDKLGMPKQYDRKKENTVTVNDEALEKLYEKFPAHRAITGTIREARRTRKQIGFLKSKLGSDGRWHSNFNVGTADTDRWSSSKSPYGEGTNLQNIADRSRRAVIADPGFMLFDADLKQAESNVVAHDAQDEAYIKAHLEGDVHTMVAKMVWPELPWTGDAKHDRAIAEQAAPWDKDHKLRWYAKHVQHGGNIGQSPQGMARDVHIPEKTAAEVYKRYFSTFPGIARRHREIEQTVKDTGVLISPLGRKRIFFDRTWDKATWRKAKSQIQQHMVAWICSMALWRLWKEFDLVVNTRINPPSINDPSRIWLLAQEHDAILGEVRWGDTEMLEKIVDYMQIDVNMHGRIMKIGADIKVGHHFGEFDPKKPETVGGLTDKYGFEDGVFVIHNRKEDLLAVHS